MGFCCKTVERETDNLESIKNWNQFYNSESSDRRERKRRVTFNDKRQEVELVTEYQQYYLLTRRMDQQFDIKDYRILTICHIER